jgi:hypothetical protein
MGLQVAEKMEEQPYNTKGKKFAAIVNRGLLASGWEIFSVFPLVWRICCYMFSDTSWSHKQIFNLELLSVVSELQYYYSTDLLLAFLY